MNTVKAPLLTEDIVSYIYAALLSESSKQAITGIQDQLTARFPAVLWLQPPETLHVTLLHLFSPESVYPESEDKLFADVEWEADRVIRDTLKGVGPPVLKFKEIGASPEAIIVRWDDGGALAEIRSRFTSRFELNELTRRPPSIVHTTIARFLAETPVEELEEFVRELKVDVVETINEVALIRETQIYLQEFRVLERYQVRH